MSSGQSRSAVWGLESSLSPVLITVPRLCWAGPEDDTGYLGTAWHCHIPVLFTLKTQSTTLVGGIRARSAEVYPRRPQTVWLNPEGLGTSWRGAWYCRECCSWR